MRPLGLLTVFCVLNFGICQARHDDQAKRNRSLSAEVSKLIILSDQYGEKKMLPARDSVLNLAIDLSFSVDSIRGRALVKFLTNSIYDAKAAREYAEELYSLASRSYNNYWLYRAYQATSKVLMVENNTPEALANVEKAFKTVALLEDETLKAECLIEWGQVLEKAGKKIDAFNNYTQGAYLAQKVGNVELENNGYDALSTFYRFIQNWEKAKDYKVRQLELFASRHKDSVEYYNLLNQLSFIYFKNNQREAAERLFYRVVRYADASKNDELKQNAFTYYKAYLFDNNQFSDLRQLYQLHYPGQWEYIRRTDTSQYYRLQAYFEELDDHITEADELFNLSAKYLKPKEGPAFYSRFYNRYGQFLVRHEMNDKAILAFELAYQYAERARYMPFMEENARYLDSLFSQKHDYEKAYTYLQLSKTYSDSLERVKKADELLISELEYQAKQQALLQQRNDEQTRRRHNLQYMAITLSITTSFIILAMLGSFKVHRWLIKGMGFFSFIFFFEFIILLADHQIHDYTHGEPWKIMGLKIVLIGVLLPLHHWLEERVVHYLSHHRLIDTSKWSFKWLKRIPPSPPPKPPIAEAHEEFVNEN